MCTERYCQLRSNMEELNYRLKLSNSMQVCQIISKLVVNIKQNKDTSLEEITEFKFLKEKCLDVDPLISKTAAAGMLALIKENPVKLQSVLADFVTSISNIKYFASIVYLLNELLLIDLKNKLIKYGNYENPYNLRLPQHPFISVLNESSESWISVYNEMKNTFRLSEEDSRLTKHIVKLYKPIFLYVICNPDENSFAAFKCKLWSILMNNADIIDELICWLQIEAEQNVVINSCLIHDSLEFSLKKDNLEHLEYLIAWEVSILYKLLLHKQDPRDTISHIKEAVIKCEGKIKCINPLILILSKSFLHCPGVNLMDMLVLCELIFKQNIDLLLVDVLKPFLLQWIANNTSLTEEAVKVAQRILSYSRTNNNYASSHIDGKFSKMIKTDQEIYTAVKMYEIMESWKDNDDVYKTLNKLEKIPDSFLVNIIYLPSLTFINDFGDSKITSKSLSLLLRCSLYDKHISNYLLTLILYKLSNSIEPELHFELLKTLPKMAVQKENVKKIAGTIFALSRGPSHLKTFSLLLMYELWKNNERCYTYLEKLLVTNVENPSSRWEFFITKAHILKEICMLKPELYGKDMVAHLSKILNSNTDEDGAIASALALEGISYLCKEGVIDVVTTWATLGPKFAKEKRVPVIKSLCVLLSVIPALSYLEAYPNFIQDVVAKLWEYTKLSYEPDIVAAGFDALSHFSFEHICSGFPENYIEDESSQDDSSKSNGFRYVSGQSWLNLLKSPRNTDLIGDFIIKVVSQEISGYLKYIYQTMKANREPTNYSYLPSHSCVRVIGEYLKKEVLGWKGTLHEKVYLECLRIFSQKYSKPLPPFDWCFLQELIHDSKTKKYSITIASRQVILSGTARRLMENYIVALTETFTQIEDVLLVYENIENLGNSIQPVMFKPFIEVTFHYGIDLVQNENDAAFLNRMLQYITAFLKNQDMQETNKVIIGEVVKNVLDKLKVDDQLFSTLLDCTVNLPTKCLNMISSPKCTTDLSIEWFKKAVTIRCEVAKIAPTDPLNWLNELINHEALIRMDEPYILEKFASVFQHHISNKSCAMWLLEMIDEIQFRVADKANLSHILFKCNTFMLAVTLFSGHSLFIPDKITSDCLLDLFPRAVATLLDVSHWSICTVQALDWFYHMNTDTYIPRIYQNVFGQALQALRHEEEFRKNLRWMKYLNCNVEF